MLEENVEVATRWYEPATGKNALLAAMPRTMALSIPRSSGAHPKTERFTGAVRESGSG